MVIKTFDAKGNKIFINLCKVDEIPEPKEKTESELLSLLESDDITDYRVPLSMLDPHDELDKCKFYFRAGKPAVVYDVAINTRFFEKIKDNQVFRDFVLEVIQQGLENKYDIELQKGGYVILRNRSSIGDLKPHRIRSITGPYKPPKRLIEEISPSEVEPRKHINFRLSRKDDMLLGEFHLPTIVSFCTYRRKKNRFIQHL
ncbi:UNVERIFIED_CONTAM: hypothetical protein PYX00_009751 [Menopon gallinae]|uniref:PIH1 N-terminal domain-containing protein n=1 Tax=Menopon gallinae TaxID=328185 RepID=A0AAW2HD93_9NEOP